MGGRNRIHRSQFAVVELEVDDALPAPRAAQRIAAAIERIGDRHFRVALGDDLQLCARFLCVGAEVVPVEEEECLLAGMNDYLGKPVKLEELLGKLRKWALHLQHRA